MPGASVWGWFMSLAMNMWPLLQTVVRKAIMQHSQPYPSPQVWQDSVHHQPSTQQYLAERHTGNHVLTNSGPEGCCEAAVTATNSVTVTSTMNKNKQKNKWSPRYKHRDNPYDQLRKQFPVSSGSEHRATEGPFQPAHLKLKLNEDWNTDTTYRREPVPTRPRFGMKMLQKMGWSPGEGLGKNKEGTTEPLVPDGLYYSQPEQFPEKHSASLVDDLSGKHPVMALTELCTKFGWSAPKFEVVDNEGPDHKKTFLMKVIVNGQEFQPPEAASNKKQAKANAAALFLQSIGLYKGPKASQ